MITQSKVKELFNHIDGKLYWKVRPANRVDISKPAGSVGADGYVNIHIKGKNHYAHRLVFILYHNYLPKIVDHINNIRHDNRIENIREATSPQNQRNSLINKRSKSGIKGVCFCNHAKKWKAQIRVGGNPLHVGYYVDINEAEKAIIKKRSELHGDFANDGQRI